MPNSPATPTPAPAKSGQAFYTERELAIRWAVSPKMLQKARLNGEGVRFHKIGSNVRYAVADVLAYERAQTRSSTSDPGGLEEEGPSQP